MAVRTTRFFEHVDAFIDYRKTVYGASDQTLKSNQIDLNLFETFINDRNHSSINGPAVIDFQYYLKTARNNSGGSINRKIFTLRSYSNFLTLMNVPSAEKLPFYDVLKIRQGYRNRPDALTRKQLKCLFEAIDRDTCLGIRDYAAYALMYQTGLRVGEVYSLNLTSVDFENQKLNVLGKGKKPRSLHLTKEIRQILSEWLAVRSFFYKSDKTNALFVSKKGNRLAIRTMEDNLKKIVRKAGLYTHFNVSCHTFRHSFASHLNDEEVDILVIQSLMGHSTPRSTEPYIHPSIEKIRQAMEKLPAVVYIRELVESGVLDLKFQSTYNKKK